MRSEKVFYSFTTIGFVILAVSFISVAKSTDTIAVVTAGEATINDHRDIVEYVDSQIMSGDATGYIMAEKE